MPHRKTQRKGLLRALALATTTGLLVAALSGTGLSYAKAPRAPSGRTIEVIEHAITDLENPVGTDLKGDILTFNNPVFNVADKKQVGHDEGFCTRVAPAKHIWECLWTTFLKGGQITVQGPYYDNRNSVLSITGGTGAYKDVRGQMPLVSRHGGKEYAFIFQLS